MFLLLCVALIRQKQFLGNTDEIFQMLMKYISLLSEGSNLILLEHEIKLLHPAYPNWLLNLKRFAHYFYQISKHSSVRLLALQHLTKIFKTYHTIYSEPIIRTLFSIFHETLERETCDEVLVQALRFWGQMLQQSSCPAAAMAIELLSKHAKQEKQATAVAVLVEALHVKWTQSQSIHTIKIYHTLVELLNHPLESTRRVALECLTQIRSNKTYQILLDGGRSSFLQLNVSTKASVLTRRRKGIASLSIHLLLNVLVNRLLKETSLDLFRLCLRGLFAMLCNNFMLAGCDLNLLTNALRSELHGNRFASTVRNISLEQRLELIVDAYHLIGIILIGYRRYLQKDQPFNLVELIVIACSESEHESVRNKCLQILGVCCIDFPAGVSYKMSSLIRILDKCSNQRGEIISGFLSCFLHSPKTLSRILSEQELTTLFSITSSLICMNQENGLQVNDIFRLLVVLLRSCEIPQRQSFYHTVACSLLKDSKCLLTEANIDLLSRYTFTDSVLDHCPADTEDNSILFSPTDQINHYVLGNTVLSIQVGNMNWIKTIIRRPSGRITWISQIQNRPHTNYTKSQTTHDVFTSLADTLDCLPPEATHSHSVSSEFSSECPPVEFESDFPESPFPQALSPSSGELSPDNAEVSFLAGNSSPLNLTALMHNRSPPEIELESWSFDQAFGVPNSYSSSRSLTDTPSDSAFPQGPFVNTFSPDESRLVFAEPEGDTLFSIETHESTAQEKKETEEAQVPLSCLYPGLPSYEDGFTSSPSLHDENDFLLGPSPDYVKENNNVKLSEDAQMLLHASKSISPDNKSPVTNVAFSVPILGHGIPASTLVQGSPVNSSILDPATSTDSSPLAKSIIDQLENTVSFGQSSTGQVTIKKSRSITAPILRHDSAVSSLASIEGNRSLITIYPILISRRRKRKAVRSRSYSSEFYIFAATAGSLSL